MIVVVLSWGVLPSAVSALPPPPRYGSAALADLLPSVLAGLGLPDEDDVLGLGPLRRVVVLLVDGLGEVALRRHADLAPFLAQLPGPTLTCGFPSTTATSLSSLGTGLPPGEHGLTGYTSYVEQLGEPVAWLSWTPASSDRDLREQLVPERMQPHPTALERAAAAGIEVTVAAPARLEGSGLTRAVLRGGRYAGTVTGGDAIAQAVEGAGRGDRSMVYCYLPDLDLTGHVRGVDSDAWREQLRLVDALAAQLSVRLPPGATLLVTGDHGMVDVAPASRVDADAVPALQAGVRALAGEPRVRHVHVRDGARDDVLATWREVLGPRAWVGSREQVVAAGLLGPVVTSAARQRIGEVVAVAQGDAAVVRSRAEPQACALVGHHGALSDDELLVPLLVASGSG